MDHTKLASGDNNSALPISPKCAENKAVDENKIVQKADVTEECFDQHGVSCPKDIALENIEHCETDLKDRITQCKSIIESLKFELGEEKAKLMKESKGQRFYVPKSCQAMSNLPSAYCDEVSTSDDFSRELSYNTTLYSNSVDSKLNCDENLMEYEKQLEKYQNTLNLAQIEKKNAIRKQMLAKAYRLKLLEVENQCNIELLRVKQSLQCLEPLQMIASKWQNDPDDASFDLDKFELMPRYPELGANSGAEAESLKEELAEKTHDGLKNDSIASD